MNPVLKHDVRESFKMINSGFAKSLKHSRTSPDMQSKELNKKMDSFDMTSRPLEHYDKKWINKFGENFN